MKAASVLIASLLFSAFTNAECVTVTGADPGLPKFQSSSQRVRITALQEGKALENVRVLFYLATDEVNPKLVLMTDKQGVVLAPDLAPGKYRILAIGPANESTGVNLEVTPTRSSRTNSFLLTIPPTFLPEKVLDIDRAPITENVREFKGRAEDASGAAIAGSSVQVYRKDSPSEPVAKIKADNNGQFAASLAPGKYVVFITSPGFVKKVIGFEIGQAGEAKALRAELRIGGC